MENNKFKYLQKLCASTLGALIFISTFIFNTSDISALVGEEFNFYSGSVKGKCEVLTDPDFSNLGTAKLIEISLYNGSNGVQGRRKNLTSSGHINPDRAGQTITSLHNIWGSRSKIEVKIPELVQNSDVFVKSEYNITEIGQNAFKNFLADNPQYCNRVIDITVPSTVETIDDNAFYGINNHMKFKYFKIYIDNLKSVGNDIFEKGTNFDLFDIRTKKQGQISISQTIYDNLTKDISVSSESAFNRQKNISVDADVLRTIPVVKLSLSTKKPAHLYAPGSDVPESDDGKSDKPEPSPMSKSKKKKVRIFGSPKIGDSGVRLGTRKRSSSTSAASDNGKKPGGRSVSPQFRGLRKVLENAENRHLSRSTTPLAYGNHSQSVNSANSANSAMSTASTEVLSSRLSTKEEELKDIREELKTLAKENAELKIKNKEYDEQIQKINQEKTEAKLAKKELETKVTKLEGEKLETIIKHRKEMDDLEQKSQEMILGKSEIIDKQNKKISELEEKIKRHKSETAKRTRERKQEEKELEEITLRFEKMSQEHEEEMLNLQAQLDVKTSQLEEKDHIIEQLRSSALDDAKNQSAKTIDQVKEISSLKSENKYLSKQLDEVKKELEEQKKSAMQSLTDKSSANGSLTEARRSLAEKDSKIERLQNQNSSLNDKVRELSQEKDQLEKRVQELEELLKQQQEQNELDEEDEENEESEELFEEEQEEEQEEDDGQKKLNASNS